MIGDFSIKAMLQSTFFQMYLELSYWKEQMQCCTLIYNGDFYCTEKHLFYFLTVTLNFTRFFKPILKCRNAVLMKIFIFYRVIYSFYSNRSFKVKF